MDSKSNITGLGMIARDSKGGIYMSACSNRQLRYQPVLAEALALRSAKFICKHLGLMNVILKGDCKVVVDAANSKEDNDSLLYPIIKDVQLMLIQQSTWKVQFSYREANQPAHMLAQLACSM